MNITKEEIAQALKLQGSSGGKPVKSFARFYKSIKYTELKSSGPSIRVEVKINMPFLADLKPQMLASVIGGLAIEFENRIFEAGFADRSRMASINGTIIYLIQKKSLPKLKKLIESFKKSNA